MCRNAEWPVDRGCEFHRRENVRVDVDAFGDLDQAKAIRGELKDRALGDVEHLLAASDGGRSVKADLLQSLHELAMPAFAQDAQLSIDDLHGQAASGEGAAENHALCALRNIHEAADAREAAAERADVDAAFRID